MLTTEFLYSRAAFGQAQAAAGAPPSPPQAAASAAPAAQAPAPATDANFSRQTTEALVRKMNEALQGINTGLEFSVDDETGWTVVKVIDRETGDTLRQFPSEEALDIAHALGEAKGALVRQKA